MSKPFDPKYYDKDEFHQGTVPAETMVSMHYSEVILKLLEQIGKGDIEEIKKAVDNLLQTCKNQGNTIDYLKSKIFEIYDGLEHIDYDNYSKESAEKETTQTSTAIWTRDKYGNVVKQTELKASSAYPTEVYQYHYGVPYDPRNPPSYLS